MSSYSRGSLRLLRLAEKGLGAAACVRRESRLSAPLLVDAKTFRIRRIEGVPARSPSIWIKDIHITLQYAEVNEMWICVSLDAIATVRLLGRYTLAALYVGVRNPASAAPSP